MTNKIHFYIKAFLSNSYDPASLANTTCITDYRITATYQTDHNDGKFSFEEVMLAN